MCWNKPAQVYGIFDGSSEHPFYIGCTSDLDARMKAHCVSTKTEVGKRCRLNKKTLYVKVYSSHKRRDDAFRQERVIITDLREKGVHLLNSQRFSAPRDWAKPLAQQFL